jgi:hypothetical protein
MTSIPVIMMAGVQRLVFRGSLTPFLKLPPPLVTLKKFMGKDGLNFGRRRYSAASSFHEPQDSENKAHQARTGSRHRGPGRCS